MALEEGDVFMCTVDRIVGTTVFVKIEGNGEGTIVTSEIAPGRIRNLRDYVSPGRKIVCKILRIQGNDINLSLRRVTSKEKKEVMEKYQKERKYVSAIKTIIPENKNIIEKIKEKQDVVDFFEKARENSKLLEEYFSKDEIEKIAKILKQTKEKEKEIKIIFLLSSQEADGIKKIKSILSIKKDKTKISYIAAGKYSITTKAENYKEANRQADEILQNVEQQAKQNKMFFEKEKAKSK